MSVLSLVIADCSAMIVLFPKPGMTIVPLFLMVGTAPPANPCTIAWIDWGTQSLASQK